MNSGSRTGAFKWIEGRERVRAFKPGGGVHLTKQGRLKQTRGGLHFMGRVPTLKEKQGYFFPPQGNKGPQAASVALLGSPRCTLNVGDKHWAALEPNG